MRKLEGLKQKAADYLSEDLLVSVGDNKYLIEDHFIYGFRNSTLRKLFANKTYIARTLGDVLLNYFGTGVIFNIEHHAEFYSNSEKENGLKFVIIEITACNKNFNEGSFRTAVDILFVPRYNKIAMIGENNSFWTMTDSGSILSKIMEQVLKEADLCIGLNAEKKKEQKINRKETGPNYWRKTFISPSVWRAFNQYKSDFFFDFDNVDVSNILMFSPGSDKEFYKICQEPILYPDINWALSKDSFVFRIPIIADGKKEIIALLFEINPKKGSFYFQIETKERCSASLEKAILKFEKLFLERLYQVFSDEYFRFQHSVKNER